MSDIIEERCWWCAGDTLYCDYHDREWGRTVVDQQRLFEKICLEGFQAGLSWLTILRKREAFRTAFHQFDFERVATMDQRDVEALLGNAAIVRHRGKIESVLNNAQRAIELREAHGSLAHFFRKFAPSERTVRRSRSEIPAKTVESAALSKELKKRGWSFVGPTTCYAFMQAMGLVNDHLESCCVWSEVEDEQRGR